MNNFKKGALILILLATFLGIKYFEFNSSLTFKIIIMIFTPIFLIWIAIKYSNSGKTKIYRVITFSAFGIWFLITIAISYMRNNYTEHFDKYLDFLWYAGIVSFATALIVGSICIQKIKDEEQKYL